jgi:hypothetical protein
MDLESGISDLRCRFDEHTAQPAARWLSHLAMHRCDSAEEAAGPPECFVDELIDDDQMSRGNFFPERADGAAAEDRVDAELLESEDIRSERHLTRREFMSLAMTIEERNRPPTKPADQDYAAGPAGRSLDIVTLRVGDALG